MIQLHISLYLSLILVFISGGMCARRFCYRAKVCLWWCRYTQEHILDQIIVKLSDRYWPQMLEDFDVLGWVWWIRDGDSVTLVRTNNNIRMSPNILMGFLPYIWADLPPLFCIDNLWKMNRFWWGSRMTNQDGNRWFPMLSWICMFQC